MLYRCAINVSLVWYFILSSSNRNTIVPQKQFAVETSRFNSFLFCFLVYCVSVLSSQQTSVPLFKSIPICTKQWNSFYLTLRYVTTKAVCPSRNRMGRGERCGVVVIMQRAEECVESNRMGRTWTLITRSQCTRFCCRWSSTNCFFDS